MIREWPSGACNQTPVRNDPRDPFQNGYMMQLRTSSPFLGIGTRAFDRPDSGLRYHNPATRTRAIVPYDTSQHHNWLGPCRWLFCRLFQDDHSRELDLPSPHAAA